MVVLIFRRVYLSISMLIRFNVLQCQISLSNVSKESIYIKYQMFFFTWNCRRICRSLRKAITCEFTISNRGENWRSCWLSTSTNPLINLGSSTASTELYIIIIIIIIEVLWFSKEKNTNLAPLSTWPFYFFNFFDKKNKLRKSFLIKI